MKKIITLAKTHKRKLIIALVVITSFTIGALTVTPKDKIVIKKVEDTTKIESLQSQLDATQTKLTASESTVVSAAAIVKACQSDLQEIYTAQSARNDIFVGILENIYGAGAYSQQIKDSNDKIAIIYLKTTGNCYPQLQFK